MICQCGGWISVGMILCRSLMGDVSDPEGFRLGLNKFYDVYSGGLLGYGLVLCNVKHASQREGIVFSEKVFREKCALPFIEMDRATNSTQYAIFYKFPENKQKAVIEQKTRSILASLENEILAARQRLQAKQNALLQAQGWFAGAKKAIQDRYDKEEAKKKGIQGQAEPAPAAPALARAAAPPFTQTQTPTPAPARQQEQTLAPAPAPAPPDPLEKQLKDATEAVKLAGEAALR
ncbi:MAG: hypothetical protein HY537_16955, partial [Deltaproteobacteria bacterium]|nr:hypothetical protein [Deltaproteobacteria bacterium]